MGSALRSHLTLQTCSQSWCWSCYDDDDGGGGGGDGGGDDDDDDNKCPPAGHTEDQLSISPDTTNMQPVIVLDLVTIKMMLIMIVMIKLMKTTTTTSNP